MLNNQPNQASFSKNSTSSYKFLIRNFYQWYIGSCFLLAKMFLSTKYNWKMTRNENYLLISRRENIVYSHFGITLIKMQIFLEPTVLLRVSRELYKTPLLFYHLILIIYQTSKEIGLILIILIFKIWSPFTYLLAVSKLIFYKYPLFSCKTHLKMIIDKSLKIFPLCHSILNTCNLNLFSQRKLLTTIKILEALNWWQQKVSVLLTTGGHARWPTSSPSSNTVTKHDNTPDLVELLKGTSDIADKYLQSCTEVR
ncbi:hypothetical protein EGR_07159 [Echinococcus granulosus]|uniref:Uncharacterized protein n=1 Tax=Echinococcus granulosus TaxID=6210 RepID=W6UIM9_ECHGR|nr:hypothetical protein EGR_07159 [Echinococcus granulosus]EUB57967.1 hypothetical protein EGR_07159 [Echinococcus granulosus]